MKILMAAAAVMLMAATTAHAQSAERDFCPSRPGKASPTCTVDPGRIQLEVNAFDKTFDKSGGIKTTDTFIATPQLRFGLSANTEFQVAWAPYERVTAKGPGLNDSASGIGDVVAALKFNLTDNRDGFGAALQPFVKIPTADDALGNGKVEGGLVVPLSMPLSSGWSLGVSPELDIALDDDGSGYHTAGALAVGLSRALSPEVSFGVELWAGKDFVSGSDAQATADLMLAWMPAAAKDLQLDVGLNFGLTSASPDVQAYVGIAKRF